MNIRGIAHQNKIIVNSTEVSPKSKRAPINQCSFVIARMYPYLVGSVRYSEYVLVPYDTGTCTPSTKQGKEGTDEIYDTICLVDHLSPNNQSIDRYNVILSSVQVFYLQLIIYDLARESFGSSSTKTVILFRKGI